MGMKPTTAKDKNTDTDTDTVTDTTQAPTQDVEVKEEQHSTETTQVVAATSANVNNQQFSERMSEQGLSGLEIGFGSFPIIRLMNDGIFADSEENEMGTEFSCKLLNTRPSYLYKQKNNSDSDVYYSYDAETLTTTTDGGSSTVAELKAEWTEDGWDLERKDYLEVVIIMEDEESEYNDEMFILSVPPSSRRKLAGVIAGLEFKGLDPKNTIIKCAAGKKRKSGSNTYYPWAFKAA